MNQRIALIRKEKTKNQDEFAEKLGLSKNFISLLETGKREPSDRTILDICKTFNVNEEWLRTGEGEIYLPRDREKEIAELTIDLLIGESDSFKSRLISALSRLSVNEWEVLEKLFEDVVETKKE